jgi:hypothetical protein
VKKLALIPLFFALSAVAAPASGPSIKDTQLGPVVAVQRELSDVEKNCLAHTVGDTDKPMYAFSCRVDFALDTPKEILMSQNPFVHFSDDTCSVDINYLKSNIVIFFGNSQAPTTFDEAKVCLKKGLAATNDKLSLLIYKYN